MPVRLIRLGSPLEILLSIRCSWDLLMRPAATAASSLDLMAVVIARSSPVTDLCLALAIWASDRPEYRSFKS